MPERDRASILDFIGIPSGYNLSLTDSANVGSTDGEEQYTQGLSAHNFRLGLSFSALSNLHFTASAIVRSVPENLDETPALAGLLTTPWELNAHILYSPIPSLDLYADFRNLTDHKYYLAGNRGPYPIQAFQGSSGVRFSF